ncbi:COX15/CtaA family protein [Reyranella sp. CPCC 100927]|uniref:COX15/CtaA family protein n=1 Tax=Reyranella sp. CPCC 100927 TaxID=2599616 RepID=UPI0011B392F7|nr:COX15/CtaA family protein [Reyranella sp. CPCC 100927]TWT02818.1 heme A synthase [Reyranella sp. CPCC 100927]
MLPTTRAMSLATPTVDRPAIATTGRADERAIGRWLAVVTAMVLAMIVLGALTRLTESGLSMVEWKPVTGWLPPLSEAAWQAELAKYAQSPQGRLVNQGISVAQFKEIFWLEYLHRLWGRLIGLAFALPMLWFFVRHRVPNWLKPRLIALLLLGGLQGAVGWIMVASGLQDAPAVSHYKLAMHLVLAVGLYAYMLWLTLGLLQSQPLTPRVGDRRIGRAAAVLIGLLLIVLTFGAFVAGLRAGQIHTTFPTMSGYWVPPGLFELSPSWLNFVATQTGTQFAHRWLAKLLVVLCLALWVWVRRIEASAPVRRATTMVAIMALIQLGLGVGTILTGAQIALATVHQAGAVLLLSTLILTLRRAWPPINALAVPTRAG